MTLARCRRRTIPFDESVIGELAVAELQRKLDFDMARFQRESLNRVTGRTRYSINSVMLISSFGKRRPQPPIPHYAELGIPEAVSNGWAKLLK